MKNEPKYFPFSTSRPLTRLRQYKRWIHNGWALDLNDAVRLNAQLRRKAHYEAINSDAVEYPARQAMITVRRREHLSRIILDVAQSCTLCSKDSPTHITHIVPPSEGGQDTLRNMVPCCRECHLELSEVPAPLSGWAASKTARAVAARLGL
ncbi:HNH endonuclease [Streptomyces sp. NBC_00726]|uniref:HNH endonuclease n=1 Tax=Streptomyces sp. NBC_00726 TaxID=2903674 RepID=UPI0038687B30